MIHYASVSIYQRRISRWVWAPGTNFWQFVLARCLTRNVMSVDVCFRMEIAELSVCESEETSSITVHPLWDYVWQLVACIEVGRFLAPAVSYACDNLAPLWKVLKCIMFFTLLAEARMFVWNTRRNVTLHEDPLSLLDLTAYFKNQFNKMQQANWYKWWVKGSNLKWLF